MSSEPYPRKKKGPGPKQGLTDEGLTAGRGKENKARDEGDLATKRPAGRLA